MFKGAFAMLNIYFKGAFYKCFKELLFKTQKVIYKFVYSITTIFIYKRAYYIVEIKIKGGA